MVNHRPVYLKNTKEFYTFIYLFKNLKSEQKKIQNRKKKKLKIS